MATVRTTTPRHDVEVDAKGKKKRKRTVGSAKGKTRGAQTNPNPGTPPHAGVRTSTTAMHASNLPGNSFADDMVRRKLDAHDKWQLCTQKNMSEIRAECMKVRRELEKVEQIADTAAMQVQDEATDFRTVREEVAKQANAAMQHVRTFESEVKAVQKASVVLENELQNLKKKVGSIDQCVQQQGSQSIDEDFLMTQLTELQERYETELANCKEEYLASVQEKQLAIDAVKKQIHQVHQTCRQEAEAANRTTAALDDELKSLSHHVHALDRERQGAMDKNGRLKMDIDDLDHRLDGLDRKLEGVVLNQQVEPRHPHHYPTTDPVIQAKLHQLNGDVRLVAEDFRRFTQRVDARHDDLYQDFTNQLRELGSELFNALDHDSRQHVIENKRVRDAVFELEGNVRDLRDGMAWMEDHMRRMTMERQRSPPRRPPVEHPIRNRRCEAPLNGGFYDAPGHPHRITQPFEDPRPCHVDPIVARRPRSRSRSRSNPRNHLQIPTTERSPHRRDAPEPRSTTLNPYAPPPQPDHPRVDSEPSHETSSASPPSPQNDTSMSEPSESARVSEHEEREASAPEPQQRSFRRTKKPRKSYEVIVIEDDESSEETTVAPDRAPPDIVAEDEDPIATVVVHEEIVPVSDGEMGSSDRLKRMSDVRFGALLYFCFGGAPTLDFEWTHYFSTLNPSDCIEMSRATSFLHRYPELQSFPIYLTQFIIQSIVVGVPVGGTQSSAHGFGSDDDDTVADKVDQEFMKAQFGSVVDTIRLSWAETLTVKLRKMLKLSLHDKLDGFREEMQISLNPALGRADAAHVQSRGSSSPGNANVPAWLHHQAKAFWWLLRHHHLGSKFPAFGGDLVASPGAYLFLLMFDAVHVNRLSPQSGTFRLSSWGRGLVTHLWDHLLSKLPYLFFADCSWLENQTESSGKLPPLGFCHMLSAILAWNSITDKSLEASSGLYGETVRLFLDCLHVNGVPVRGNEHVVSLPLNESDAAEIEMIGVNTKLVSLLQLDGFFEVADAIQAGVSSATGYP